MHVRAEHVGCRVAQRGPWWLWYPCQPATTTGAASWITMLWYSWYAWEVVSACSGQARVGDKEPALSYIRPHDPGRPLWSRWQ